MLLYLSKEIAFDKDIKIYDFLLLIFSAIFCNVSLDICYLNSKEFIHSHNFDISLRGKG